MGNICSSCCECDKGKYKSIEGEDGTTFQDEQGSEFKTLQSELDMKSPVFEGSIIPRKFSRNRKYENRFMWVNIDSKTIHMSTHNTKDRRHKEASLADVSSILKGAPNIADGLIGKPSCCLTVNFQKDSGIDLCFSTETECDLWYTVLSRIIKLIKKSETVRST
jgi:hypothetical protein